MSLVPAAGLLGLGRVARPRTRFRGRTVTPVLSPACRRTQPDPLVSVQVTPGFALAGDRIDVLVMVANEHPRPLSGLWLGLVLPAGLQLGSVTPPAGTAALPDPRSGRTVLRCPLADLPPGDCVGLDAELLTPARSGPLALTGFVTIDEDPAVTVTATKVLPVL